MEFLGTTFSEAENASLNTLKLQLKDLNNTLIHIQSTFGCKIDVSTQFRQTDIRLVSLSVYKPIEIK